MIDQNTDSSFLGGEGGGGPLKKLHLSCVTSPPHGTKGMTVHFFEDMIQPLCAESTFISTGSQLKALALLFK